MIKLKTLSRAVVVPAVMAGATIMPLLGASPVSAATSTLYWYGTGSAYPGASGNSSASLAANTESNWSTSNASYVADTDTGSWADGVTLMFNTGTAPETITGQVNGTAAGIEVVAGGITLSDNVTGTPEGFQTGAELKVDTPSTSTNFLAAGYIKDNGGLTLDGITEANTPTANAGDVTGPLTVEVSDSNVTAATDYTYTATDLTNLLGTPSSNAQVNFGKNTALTLASSDFGLGALNWTFQANTGSVINLTGSSATGGAVYGESFIGNGGDFVVATGSGTANLHSLTLNADSFVGVVDASDALTATTFTPNGHTLAADAIGNQGTYPTSATGGSTGGTTGGTGGSGGGSGAVGPTSTSTKAPKKPKAPDTGFAKVSATVAPVLATTVLAAGALFFIARSMKPASKKR